MKNFWKILPLFLTLFFIGNIAFAQMGGGMSTPGYLKKVSGVLEPTIAGIDFGSPGNPFGDGYFGTLHVTGVEMTDNLIVGGNATIDGYVAITATVESGATSTTAENDGYIRIKYTDTNTHAVTLHDISTGDIEHCFKDADYNAGSNAITITADGSDTIEEGASIQITVNGDSRCIKADAVANNWEVF